MADQLDSNSRRMSNRGKVFSVPTIPTRAQHMNVGDVFVNANLYWTVTSVNRDGNEMLIGARTSTGKTQLRKVVLGHIYPVTKKTE